MEQISIFMNAVTIVVDVILIATIVRRWKK